MNQRINILHSTPLGMYRRLRERYTEDSLLACVEVMVNVKPKVLVNWDIDPSYDLDTSDREKIFRALTMINEQHPNAMPLLKMKRAEPSAKAKQHKRSYVRREVAISPEQRLLEERLRAEGRLNPS